MTPRLFDLGPSRFTVAALAVMLASCSGAPPGPGEVATAFARKWESGDCTGLATLVTSDRGIVAGGVEQACAGRAALRKAPLKEISEIRVAEAREDGDRAVVRLETRYADGSAQAGDPLVLVKQADGSWRVDLVATGASRVRGLFRPGSTPAAPPPAPANGTATPGKIV